MATKHEEVTHVLKKAGEEDIEIIHLTYEMVIHIKTAPKPATQWLWLNYPPPVALHDYRYLG